VKLQIEGRVQGGVFMEGDVWSPSIKLLSPTRRVSRRQIKFLGLAQGISPWAR